MSFRYLIGPCPAGRVGLPEDETPRECVTYAPKGADVPLGPADSLEAVEGRMPAGWRPDAVVVLLGRGGVPAGLWSARVPLVAVAYCPRRHWHAYRHVLGRCDLVVSDAEGAERLRRLGVARVHVPTLWGPALAMTAFPPPETVRDLDVLFVGDTYAAAQRERLPWLGRLARLAERWRLLIRPAGDAEDVSALLRRARIAFFLGPDAADLRRLEQAAAAGALPFLPADDRAAGPWWRDRVNCVRYGPDDLEALLGQFLDDEGKRRRLAEAARSGLFSAAAPPFWDGLFEAVERGRASLAESAAARAPWGHQEELLARAWQETAGGWGDIALADDLTAALEAGGKQPALRHALGLLCAGRPGGDAAAEHFRRVLRAEPIHPLAGLNRAEALARAGATAEAIAQARHALGLLDDPGPPGHSLLGAGHYPPGPDVFSAEWERAAWEHVGDPAGEARAKLSVLRWRLHGLLARLTGELPHRYEAALARPDLPATRATLGSALAQAGRPGEAVPYLRDALAGNPFDNAAARLLHQTLGALGRHEAAEALARDRRLLHRATPALVPAEAWFLPAPALPAAGQRPRLSLCMIVKDEEANLPACLATAADLVDETVVVDTGSADRTREVAARCGARVFHFAWCDSFAAARNESLRHATGDWVFWLDADDRLDEDNRRRLRALLAGLGGENAAYLMRQLSPPDSAGGGGTAVDQVRLFRNDPRVRWEYRVHEQVLPAVLRAGAAVRPTDVVIHHGGYRDAALRRRKVERNRRLLLLDQAERPDDPLTLCNLGAMHLDLGRPEEAVAFLRRSLARSPEGFSLLPRVFGLLTLGMRRLGRAGEALDVCRQGRLRCPGDGDLLFAEAQLLFQSGDLAGAEACLLRLVSTRPQSALSCVDPAVHGYKGRHLLACVLQRQGRPSEAERQWREALADRPDFLPGLLGLAELCLEAGDEAAAGELLAGLGADTAGRTAAPLVRARRLLARREFAAARAALRATAGWPHDAWARFLLGMVSAAEGGELEEGRRAWQSVLALGPHAPEAGRLLSRIGEVAEMPPAESEQARCDSPTE